MLTCANFCSFPHRSSARSKALLSLAASLALFHAANRPLPAATTDNWTLVGSGNWSNAGAWTNLGSGHTVPAAGDTVNIVDADGNVRTITLDVNSAAIAALTVDLTGAGTASNTLSIGTTTLTVTGGEIIGNAGRGAVTQSGGNNTITGNLSLGAQAAGVGTYTLNSGNLSAANIYVGGTSSAAAGNAVVYMYAGSVTTTTLKMYAGASNFGTFYMFGGNLTLSSINTSGSPNRFYFGGGNLTINTGLTLDASGPLGNSLTVGSSSALTLNNAGFYIGTSANASMSQSGIVNVGSSVTPESLFLAYGATGNYSLAGNGTLNVSSTEYIGYIGSGNFFQSGGTHNANDTIFLGYGGTGNYTLGGGTLNVTGIGSTGFGLTVGYGDGTNCTFTQTGGALNVTNGQLAVGYYGSGTYLLSGGSISVTNGSEMIFNGAFSQTGGTHTVGAPGNTSSLSIGSDLGPGTYSLSGGNLSVNGYLYVGSSFTNAAGVFNISNGNATVSFDLNIYNSPGGAVNLSGGSLSVGSLTTNGYPSTFNWTGGTFSVTGFSGLVISPTGPLGSSLSLGSTRTLNVTNTLSIQSGGTLALSGGTLTVGALDTQNTPSRFNWTGGTLALTASSLTIDSAAASAPLGANVTIANGQSLQMLNNWNETIGDAANGSVTQTGGLNSVAGLTIGNQATAFGSYTLNASTGTATLQVANTEVIGLSATGNGSLSGGVFNQSAGNNTVGLFATIASQAGSTGTYNLSGGNLAVGGELNVGQYGNGTFNQSGGNVSVSTLQQYGFVVGGFIAAGVGTYNMTGANGTPTLLAANGEYVGYLGNGTFNQSAGIHTIKGGLNIGDGPGATGTFNLSGGSLNADNIYVGGGSFGQQGTGVFNVSNNASVTTTGLIKVYNTANTTLNLSGGSITTASLDISANPGLFVWNAGTLTQSPGGTFNVTTLVVPSAGSFIFNGGSFTGHLFNTGTVTFNSFFTATGGFDNSATVTPISQSAGGFFQGAGLNNTGVISLAGGSIGGPINNSGLLTGYGSISGSTFVNTGTITQSGGPLVITANGGPNAGTINGAPGLLLQNNGAFTSNDGSVALNGATFGNSANFTNNADGLITGPGKITGAFQNNGALVVPSGSLNIANSWNNTGTINLTAAGASLSGGTITNNSAIQGAGTISASVTNAAGSIEPLGGALTLSGTLTNPATGALYASAGNKLLVTAGLATNAGLISLSGGTFDNNNHPLNNTGQITGFGNIRTGGGGLTNNNILTLTDGPSTINGDVTNAAGKTILAKNFPALFTGNITNNGIIKTTSTTVTFTGNYIGNTYISDPATNIFQQNATTIPGGLMTGSTGDVFIFNTFTNNGTFQNGGNLSVSASITNTATFSQSGPQSWLPGATFTNTAGSATFASNAKLYGLAITAGTVDITSSKFVIEPTNKATTLAILQSNIANHSLTASGMPSNFGLALLDNALLNKSTFGGNPTDTSSLLLSEELLGDTNIDGHVDLTDLSTLLNNFGTTTGAWTSGNFDHAPTVDLTDLAAVLNNFGLTNPNASTSQLPITNYQSSTTLAPEPASLPIAAAVSILLARRRKLAKNPS